MNESAVSSPSSVEADAPNTNRAAKIAWILNEAARAPYNTLVNVFIFSTYFSTVVVPDPVQGQILWSYIAAFGALVGIVGAPILGAIADAGGRCKPWIAAFTLLALPSLFVLSLATPGMEDRWIIILALLGGTIFYEFVPVFANALLTRIVPKRDIGVMSGHGVSASNVATILALLFFLFAWIWTDSPLFGLEASVHEPERAIGPLVAIWLAVFALPLFLLTPDNPKTGRNMGEAIRVGLMRYRATFATLRVHREATRFLIARIVFNEGMVGLMMFTAVYAAGVMRWTTGMLTASGLISSLFAIAGGVLAGFLDRRVGSRNTTAFFIVGGLVATVLLCSTSRDTALFVELAESTQAPDMFRHRVDQILLATFSLAAFAVSGCIASSRALMAKITPRGMENEFFGFYAFSGISTSFVAPTAVGLVTAWFNSQRAGVAVGIGFLIIGFILLQRVCNDHGMHAGGNEPPSESSHF